ncbi:sensor histidine kinase [Gandjariella thermophila]|uniref:sensor histidine kinase n=1 Tax=Gandjariella thermophila TaxID=1931992 RepID=UPI001CEF8783|nr:ATP-binding protein [Gandjariella thermophila]
MRSSWTPALLVLLAAVLVTGGAWLWVAFAAPAQGMAWYGVAAAVLLSAAVAVAAYQAQGRRRLRARVAALDAEAARLVDEVFPAVVRRLREGESAETALAAAPDPAGGAHQRAAHILAHEIVAAYRGGVGVMEAEATRMAEETLPAAVEKLRGGSSADTALAAVPIPANDAHQRILELMVRQVADGQRRRAAAMASCANAAGRVQALTTSMAAELRDMQHRHGDDPDVFGDLLTLDHINAQAGRLADSIALLSGARSGRRWTKPIVMESILRGAMGRISAYQRVELHCTTDVAVVGYAAEGVMHVLAELMDNATSFSPPAERVHVYVEEVMAGLEVIIEDGGIGMNEAARHRAEEAVSAEPLDLTELPGTRLGLAVVGRLARKHDLTVSFRRSSRGGTRVEVIIPRPLLTEARRESGSDAGRTAPAPAAASGEQATETVTETTAGGLPKRPKGKSFAAPGGDTGVRDRPARPRVDPGARFGAFRAAGRVRRTESEDAPQTEEGR